MAWRKWIIRAAVLLVFTGAALGYWTYRTWTNPHAVRQTVLAELAQRLPGAHIQLESAEFRLFGGVRLQKLTLGRRDQPAEPPFAVLPEVICYPDKEQLGRGNLVLRKIAIERPTLVVTRQADGQWNLAGLAAPVRQDGPPPILEVRQATILVVDQAGSGSNLQFTGVELAIVPTSGTALQVHLTGQSDLAGSFSGQGTLDTETGELNVSFRLPEIQLRPALIRHLAGHLGGKHEAVPEVEGTADVEGTLAYHPGISEPLSWTARLTIHQGQIRHPRLPVPLEELDGVAVVEDLHIRLERLDGKVHGGQLAVTGEASFDAEGNCQAAFDARVADLPITPALYDKLPPHSRKFCHEFNPVGPIGLTAKIAIANGKLETPHYVAQLQGLTLLFVDFPYPVERLMGTLTYDENRNPPTLQVQLNGIANRRPAIIRGTVFGPGLRRDCDWKTGMDLDISGDDLVIDEKFYTALAPYPETTRVATEFHPQGLVNFHAKINRDAATGPMQKPPPRHHITLRFHDAAFCYDRFPYPQEQVVGTLELWQPENKWRFHDFTGKHQGGTFSGWAESHHDAEGRKLTINIKATNALLDREVESALDADMKAAWRHFNPAGRADCQAVVKLINDARPDLDIKLIARGCNMRPSCFPYQLMGVKGTFHYANDRIRISDLDARHRDSRISMEDATVFVLPDGGSYSEMRNLRAEPVSVDDDFLDALPSLLRGVFVRLHPDQPIVLVLSDLIVNSPAGGKLTQYAWDGSIACVNCRWHCGLDLSNVTGLIALRGRFTEQGLQASGNLVMERATLARQPFRQVVSAVNLQDKIFVLDGLQAKLYGGEVNIPLFRIQFGDTVNYWLKLTGSKIDLQQFAQDGLDRKGQVQGKADVELTLSGRGNDLRTLQGAGWIKIPNGAHIYDLPLVVDLLTFLSGKVPRGSAFQEADGQFTIDGEKLKVSKLELLGDALSLRGEGEMQVDGTNMNLEMYGLLLGRQLPLLPPLLDQIPPAVSKRLMKIRARGSLGNVQVTTEPLPVVLEPLKAFWQRMRD